MNYPINHGIEARQALPPSIDEISRDTKLGQTGLTLWRLAEGDQLDGTRAVIEDVLAEGIEIGHVKPQLPFHLNLLRKWESSQKEFKDISTQRAESELRARVPGLNSNMHLNVQSVGIFELRRSRAPRRRGQPMPVLGVKFAPNETGRLYEGRRLIRKNLRDMSPVDYGIHWDPDEWSTVLRLAKIETPFLPRIIESDFKQIADSVPRQLIMTRGVNPDSIAQ